MANLDKILNKTEDNLQSVILVYSEDRYLLSDFKNKFIQRFIGDKEQNFNFSIVEEEDNFASALKNRVNTPPFLADKRYIIARTDHFFTCKTSSDGLLIKLFKNFPSTTILLLLVDGKIDKRLSINKQIKKIGDIIEAVPPRYKELDFWIENEFRKRGLKVDHRTIKFLEQMFNNKLELLKNEIEKIALYRSGVERITFEDIKHIISKDRLLEDNIIFALTDALIEKDRGKALLILNEMLEGGAVPLRIMSTIVWQLRLFLSVKCLKEQGKTSGEIARTLKVHKYPVEKCYRKSSNYTEEELELMLEGFLNANLQIVTGKYESKMAMEMAILGQ